MAPARSAVPDGTEDHTHCPPRDESRGYYQRSLRDLGVPGTMAPTQGRMLGMPEFLIRHDSGSSHIPACGRGGSV